MNPFELNKILGAILASCIVVNLLSDSIFAPAEPAEPGFKIAVQEKSDSSAPAVETAAPIETRLASANVDRGKSESRICMTCQTLEKGGPNKIGPNLWAVVDRPQASEPGYDYSTAMKAKGGKWTFEELDRLLIHPQGYIPGTKMTFSGIQNPE